MFIKDWKKDLLTIPNMLSLFRLLLIPVYVIIYMNADGPVDFYIAGGILAVSCLTDMIDGQIARHFNMISTVGKVLDPLADKATQFTMILCLAIKIEYPVLYALIPLFVLKELFQLFAGFWALRKGKMLKGALISGKISTTILFISLIVLVIFPMKETQVTVIMIIDGIALLIAFLHYAITYFTGNSKFQEFERSEKSEDQ